MKKDHHRGFLRGRRASTSGGELHARSPVTWFCGEGPNDFVALSVDHCVALGSAGIFVAGWMLESDGQVDELRVGHGDDEMVDPRTGGGTVERADVVDAFSAELEAAGRSGIAPEIGFAAFLPTPANGGNGGLGIRCSGEFGERRFSIRATAGAQETDALLDNYGTQVRELVPGSGEDGGGLEREVALDEESALSKPSGRGTAASISLTRIDRDSRKVLRGNGELRRGQPVTWRIGGGESDFAAICVDHCVRVGDAGVLVAGWFLESAPGSLTLRCGAGEPVDPRGEAGIATERVDVVESFERRLAEAGIEPDPEDVGFGVFLPAPPEGPESTVIIRCATTGGEQQFTVAVDDSLERIASLVREAWDFVSEGLAPHLGEELGGDWWTALAHVAPPLADSSPIQIGIDRCIAVPGRGPVISGWMVNGTGKEARLFICSTTGEVAELTPGMIYGFRGDVHALHRESYDLRNLEQGFLAHPAELEVDDDATLLAVAATESEIVGRFMVGAPRSGSTPMRDVEALLALVAPSHPELRRVMDCVGGAVSKIWSERPVPDHRLETFEFGVQPADPRLSIIVPIYGRWDFIEYQLALFSRDPEMRDHELIYMIDDPAIFEAVLLYSRSIQPLYELPFRLAYGHDNFGFAGANNAGAIVARGDLLLLLNSDVMPKRPGWSGELLAAYDELESPGAVGVRLLYHDGSIQHAGMEFQRSPAWGGMWANIHPAKGQPASSDPARGPTRVQALTAACMLLETATYRELGGLDEGFIVGDFEDSDICLKLAERGLHNYYLPHIELYHLERQSQELGDLSVRAKLTLYNCWRNTSKWNETIERIVAGESVG